MKKKLILIVAFLIHGSVFSQTDPRAYEDAYITQIEPIVKAQFGSQYGVGVVVIDSLVGTRMSAETDEITDPFSTLQHCILFTATKDDANADSGFIGIFKNGSILWHSDRVISGQPLHTFATEDINNNGQVDILTTWFHNDDPGYQGMWIFGWNGATGTILNQTKTGHSDLSAISGVYFELIDANSDGIMELQSILFDGKGQTFVWNGTSYVLGSVAQQIPQRTFLPANQLTPSVSAKTSLAGSVYTYNYTWSNNTASKQAIHSIYLKNVRSSITPIKPAKWLFAAWPDTPVVGWNSVLYFNEMIKPGKNRTDFGLVCSGLPVIATYYVQGYRATPLEADNDAEISTTEYRNDIFTNSVNGKTIGPKDPSSPFDSLKFLDTLKSYINQGRSLSWITNQTSANKYTVFFDSARAQIVRQSGRSARITLDTVIANAKRDSGGVLTNEAYALIKYNAEYLKGHLPKTTINVAEKQSWNMISVPVEVSDFRKATLYPTASTPAYAYKSAYVTKDTLTNGTGYWLKFPSNQTIPLIGLRIDSLRIPVNAGWNMIGSISSDFAKSKVTVENITVPTTYYGYSPGTGYFQADTLKPGFGYWTKASATGTIILDASSSAIQPAQPPGEEPPPNPDVPLPPELFSPSNGATGQSLSPTLIWATSNLATSYRLQVSTGSTFASTIFNDSTITTNSKQIGSLSYSTTYYWRVNAKNSSGTSQYSSIWYFTTQAAPPPPCDCCNQDLTALDQFTVTDAEGHGQSMFVNNGGKQLGLGLADVEMPPEPVTGAFHGRFQSGKFIETIPPTHALTAIPIIVKNVALPFTVSWNIQPGNKTQYWLTDPGTGNVRTLLSGTGSASMNSTGNGVILIQAQASQPCDQ